MRVWVRKEVKPLYERASWTHDTELKQEREAKWRQKSWYDKTAREFALSKARFDPDEEDLWEVCYLVPAPPLFFPSTSEFPC